MGLSPYGCTRMVAELLLGHQTPWMLPRSIPGVLFHSGGLVGPPWVPKECPLSGLGDRTPYAPRRRGGPTSGGVPFSIIKSFFRPVFFVAYPPQTIGVFPTWEPSKPRVIG